MVYTGKITESLKNAGRRFVKFIGMGRDDAKQHRAIAPWGDESAPIKGAVAIYANSSVSGEAVVIGYINQDSLESLKPGERRIFSTDADGVLQIEIYLRNDGKIELGGNADNLVRYAELKKAFDLLRQDLNSHIANYNAHTHGLSVVPPALISTPSTADMSSSKIDELLST